MAVSDSTILLVMAVILDILIVHPLDKFLSGSREIHAK